MKKPAKKPAKKAATKKAATKKAAKKTPAKKTPAKKAAKKTAKKASSTTKKVAKKATTKGAKKAAPKTAKKAAKKTASKKAAPKKAAPKKAASKKTASKKAEPTKAAPTKAAPTKAAPTKAAATRSTASEQSEVIALPAKKKPLNVGAYGEAPRSGQAAVTLVPATGKHPGIDEDDDGDDDVEVEDTLARNIGAAFDGVFGRSAASFQGETPVERSKRLAVPFVAGDPTEDLAQACAALALDKKADDIVILKVADLTSYADFFVIAAAPSERQVISIARNVADELKKRGKIAMSTDGMDQGNWVIVDYGSVVLHVFLQSARSYYDLDGFWVDAPRVTVDEARGLGALQEL